MTITFAARSHPGLVRGNNEDNLYVNGVTLTPENRNEPFALAGGAALPCLFAVCDGMGGGADGEWASLTAADALRESAAAIMTAAPGEREAAVNACVTMANDILCAAMRDKTVRIGTTLALALVAGDGVFCYGAGDSRIYALRGGALTLVSEDHTLVMQKVKMGILSEEQARRDKDWHKLTRYLGIFEDEMRIAAEAFAPLPPGPCRLLLCSDGLTDLAPDAQIAAVLRYHADPDRAAEALLQAALYWGGKDNITCVVIDIAMEENPHEEADRPAARPGEPRRPFRRLRHNPKNRR
ncbi:MAG: protein phosphatase 2C domain-containing protein [Firmicutes bacterium]|nr:protein phosphatase 2C domain-containing protein [Bacillota bacterium]